MRRILGLTLLAMLVLATAAAAAEKNGGLAASYATPKADFADVVSAGFGASVIFDYPLDGIINMTGAMGWYRFSARTPTNGTDIKTESTNLWEFAAGPQVDFGVLYVGFEGGYYTNLGEWGLVPNLGIRKNMMDLALRYKMTDEGQFLAFRAGVFF